MCTVDPAAVQPVQASSRWMHFKMHFGMPFQDVEMHQCIGLKPSGMLKDPLTGLLESHRRCIKPISSAIVIHQPHTGGIT